MIGQHRSKLARKASRFSDVARILGLKTILHNACVILNLMLLAMDIGIDIIFIPIIRIKLYLKIF